MIRGLLHPKRQAAMRPLELQRSHDRLRSFDASECGPPSAGLARNQRALPEKNLAREPKRPRPEKTGFVAFSALSKGRPLSHALSHEEHCITSRLAIVNFVHRQKTLAADISPVRSGSTPRAEIDRVTRTLGSIPQTAPTRSGRHPIDASDTGDCRARNRSRER